jgi:hypothetical protein
MNISTGGPHILLFERDQQLAALLMSELQLVGYEGHTARTAVEVFDAIARYPVRLVLVNLAQAAAARREFWVALDTQRRGSSIQVLTFHCTNLAGYGPRDPEDRPATLADMEIDGMLGMMSLLDAVRARVPNGELNANTMPRMNRTPSPTVTPRYTQPIPTPNSMLNNGGGVAGTNSGYRNTIASEGNNQFSSSRMSASSLSQTPQNVASAPPSAQQTNASYAPQMNQAPQKAASSFGSENTSNAYPERIRAVIYPNQQRAWNASAASNQETNIPPSDNSVLQRLASGQLSADTTGESGLAQLTRMVQESQAPQGSAYTYQPQQSYSQSYEGRGGAVAPSLSPATQSQGVERAASSTSYSSMRNVSANDSYVSPVYVSPTARVSSASEAISSQSLRPAPIQDLPEERPTTSPLSTDGQRRPDVLSRTNYNQQPSAQIPTSVAQSPLASIATSGTTVASTSTPTRRDVGETTNRQTSARDGQNIKEDLAAVLQTALQAKMELVRAEKEKEAALKSSPEYSDTVSSEPKQEIQKERQSDEIANDDDEIFAKNSVILDILQSLPPMPAPGQQQAMQPQVLNGRATRSLGSVLLDGHLVPQDRLEVAQNIQRMLRGVDLNYQLGEILLMFKLLTPDQLLAASLVSYGLITTTQISAFGRIRQELHSIGLEYDLENLLILFRILTPEQLREARSNMQG